MSRRSNKVSRFLAKIVFEAMVVVGICQGYAQWEGQEEQLIRVSSLTTAAISTSGLISTKH